MAPRTPPSLKARLALLLAPPLLLLGGAEAVFRLRDDLPWYAQLEDEQFFQQRRDYAMNSMHLRDREYESPAPEGHRRILFLGDSFTFGTGVPDPADRFTDRLEARLNADPPRPEVQRYDVLNAAIPGMLTDQWLLALQGPGRQFGPDLVVGVFFLRDGTTLGLRKDLFNPIRERMVAWMAGSRLARWSATYRYFRGQWMARELSREYVQSFQDQYFGDQQQTREWRNAQRRLREIRQVSSEMGAPFVLVIFPVLFGLEGDYPFEAICAEIERYCAGERLEVFSLLPAFRGRDARDLWVSKLDQHPNEDGHRIAADALEPWLRELLAR